MASRFDEFIERLLPIEGGFSDDRRDPGNWTGGKVGVGRLLGTKYGIAASSHPHLDIRSLTWDQAKAIYFTEFWLPARCDRLAPSLGYQLLDGAVNSGIPQATRWLQRALGVADDGLIGKITLGAAAASDHNDVLLGFLAERLEYLSRLSGWEFYSRGWARRIARNLRYAAQDN